MKIRKQLAKKKVKWLGKGIRKISEVMEKLYGLIEVVITRVNKTVKIDWTYHMKSLLFFSTYW